MISLIASIVFSATYNGCPIERETYAPLEIHACGQVYLSTQPGLAVYSHDAVLTVPGPVTADRVFASSFQ